MTIELKQAAQQALEALKHAEKDSADFQRINTDQTSAAIAALHTAIQQAEKSEPVAWGWAIVDNKGLERRIRARIQDFFGSNQEAKPFSLEDVAREDREFAGCAPHRVITLFTHPAPGVPDGYVLVPIVPTEEMLAAGDAEDHWHTELIYAAMLAAAQASTTTTPQPKEPS